MQKSTSASFASAQSAALESPDCIRELILKNPPTIQVDAAAAAEPAETLPPRKKIEAQLSRLMDAANMVHVVATAIKDEQACAEARSVLSIAQDTLYDVNSEIECELRDWQPPGDDSAVPRSAHDDSAAAAEPVPAEPRTWHDVAPGSIADMISSQPGGAEEALRRLKGGAALAEVCGVASAEEMPAAENTGPAARPSGGDELVSAATLIRTAIGRYSNEREPAPADRASVQHNVEIANESLTKWAQAALEAEDGRLDGIYDVIDGLTVAEVLLKALDGKPFNRVTTAPIVGTLRLALVRLEAVSQGSPEAAETAIHPSLAEYIRQQQDRARGLQDMLERLSGTYEEDNGALDLAARVAHEINEALDSVNLSEAAAGAAEGRP